MQYLIRTYNPYISSSDVVVVVTDWHVLLVSWLLRVAAVLNKSDRRPQYRGGCL